MAFTCGCYFMKMKIIFIPEPSSFSICHSNTHRTQLRNYKCYACLLLVTDTSKQFNHCTNQQEIRKCFRKIKKCECYQNHSATKVYATHYYFIQICSLEAKMATNTAFPKLWVATEKWVLSSESSKFSGNIFFHLFVNWIKILFTTVLIELQSSSKFWQHVVMSSPPFVNCTDLPCKSA